jgi:hypothetical protein
MTIPPDDVPIKKIPEAPRKPIPENPWWYQPTIPEIEQGEPSDWRDDEELDENEIDDILPDDEKGEMPT